MRDDDDTLECSTCGDIAAKPDRDVWFTDGQALICGCAGWVVVEEDGVAWVNSWAPEDEP